ncbi:44638_t:CDS:2, partial [Gigaspora margarita]
MSFQSSNEGMTTTTSCTIRYIFTETTTRFFHNAQSKSPINGCIKPFKRYAVIVRVAIVLRMLIFLPKLSPLRPLQEPFNNYNRPLPIEPHTSCLRDIFQSLLVNG